MEYQLEKILNICSPLHKDLHSFVHGHLRDNKWFDNLGNIRISCVVTSLLVYASSSGSPVLDEETGLHLGIVNFGFTDEVTNTTDIGFCGGCGISTIKIILDRILNNINIVFPNNYKNL